MTLFLEWNAKINLSAARTPDALAEHVADCFALLPHISEQAQILDVGAGGGLPGLVLAIARPNASVVSLEPLHKKHAFLRHVARTLSLTNFQAYPQRLEDHKATTYDVAVSRATWDIDEWLRKGLMFVDTGGQVLAMEGLKPSEFPGLRRVSYPFFNKQRAIVIVTKG